MPHMTKDMLKQTTCSILFWPWHFKWKGTNYASRCSQCNLFYLETQAGSCALHLRESRNRKCLWWAAAVYVWSLHATLHACLVITSTGRAMRPATVKKCPASVRVCRNMSSWEKRLRCPQHSVLRNRGALWSERCCSSMWVLLHNESAERGQTTPFFAWFLSVMLLTGTVRRLPCPCHMDFAGRAGQFVLFIFLVVIYFVISFFSIVLMHWWSLCALVWAWVCILFCTMRCMHCVLSRVQRHLSDKRGCTDFTSTCARLRELFFFLACVSVCAFVWEIKSVIHNACVCVWKT